MSRNIDLGFRQKRPGVSQAVKNFGGQRARLFQSGAQPECCGLIPAWPSANNLPPQASATATKNIGYCGPTWIRRSALIPARRLARPAPAGEDAGPAGAETPAAPA